MVEIEQEELKALKGQGFLLMKDKEKFACRIIFPAGMATAGELKDIAEIAEKYAEGIIVTTVRLNVELPGIKYENIEPMKNEMDSRGLIYGGTGAKVRPLVCCKGTVCKFGLIDTQGLCKELHNKFFPMDLPHKFKINITGCPNNCAKAQLNDIGFMGAPKNKLRLFIGGKFGRKSIMGEEICKFPLENASEVTQICIDFFKKHGNPKERFGDTIIRIKDSDVYSEFIDKLKSYGID